LDDFADVSLGFADGIVSRFSGHDGLFWGIGPGVRSGGREGGEAKATRTENVRG
jgi:hypothetical protein